MNRHDFDSQVRALAIIDRIFKVVTPVFCAVVLLGILYITLWRGAL